MISSYLELPRSVHVLCVGQLVNRAGSFLMPFLTIYLSGRLGLPERFATYAMGLFGLGSIIAALVGGHLADQIGRRRVMVMSLGSGAAILAVFGFLENRAVILGAIFVFALMIDMYRPASQAMIGDLVAPSKRPHAFGLMYVAINLGFAIGAWVGGNLAEVSFVLLYFVDAATTATFAVVILLLIPETLGRHPWSEGSESSGSMNSGSDGSVEGGAAVVVKRYSAREAAGHILRDGPFLVFCVANLLNGIVFMQAMSTFPLYLKRLGFPPSDYGQVIAINGLLIVLAQLPVTAFLSRFHRARMITIGTLLFAAGFGSLGMCGSMWQFAAAIVVWTCGEMMQAAFSGAIVSDLAPPALRARYMGVFSMSFAGALFIGAPLGGEVLSRFGGRTLWTGAFFASLVSACLYMSIYRHLAGTRGGRAAGVEGSV